MRVRAKGGAFVTAAAASGRTLPKQQATLVKPGDRFHPEELSDRDHFLMPAFGLQPGSRQLGYAQIEHSPWPSPALLCSN